MDNDLFRKVQQDDEKAFEHLFRLHYTPLCRYAYTLLASKEESEEVVQEIFVKIWLNRKKIEIRHTFASYILRAVKNESLNHLNKNARSVVVSINNLSKEEVYHIASEDLPDTAEAEIMQQKLIMAIGLLPSKCRRIFELSRFEKKKYKEIAEELELSVKTVEAQMTIAFKKLRSFIKLIIWIILIS